MQFAGQPPQQATAISNDVWGHGAIVSREMTICDGAMVAAGAAAKDVPTLGVWAGMTLKKSRDRFAHRSQRVRQNAMHPGPSVHPAIAERPEDEESAVDE